MLYFFSLFGWVLAGALVKRQSSSDYVITSIDIPPGGTILAGTIFTSTVYATVSSSFNTSTQVHTGSYELLTGAKDAANSAVVDLMFWNEPTFGLSVSYFFPANLPPGPYHFRVNITNDNGNSALSDTFQVIAPVFDCLTPPPWKNITSVSDPNYRSFLFQYPQAGTVIPLGFNLEGSMLVTWDFKDYQDNVISLDNLQFDFVNANTGQPTGLYDFGPSNVEIPTIPFAGTNLTPGPWRIRVNYSNPNEGTPIGSTVSSISEVIYFSGEKSMCDGIGRTDKSAGSHNGDTGQFQSGSSCWKLAMGLAGFVLVVWSV